MEEKTDQEKSLDEMLDEEINTWNPQPGDKLIGKYAGCRPNSGKFKTNLHLMNVERDQGMEELIGVWGGKIVDEKLKDVREGTTVGIKFLGIQKGQAGDYKNFRVIIQEDSDVSEPLKSSEI